ncbi:MAG: TetR family transcriptional regulator C-terminal domain-containing protein [Thermodesulfobacteriota bacterium]
MTKESTRARLLAEGARIVHERGFNNTGIQEILEAAGVPKGSFYFYFKSKDDFGLEICDFYCGFMAQWMDRHLDAGQSSHMQALRGFFDEVKHYFAGRGCKSGCPVGNIAQEMADLNDAFRDKVEGCLRMMTDRIARCLRAAQDNGEVDPSLDAHKTAEFILNSWEGAVIRMKTRQSIEPLDLFADIIFGRLLKP